MIREIHHYLRGYTQRHIPNKDSSFPTSTSLHDERFGNFLLLLPNRKSVAVVESARPPCENPAAATRTLIMLITPLQSKGTYDTLLFILIGVSSVFSICASEDSREL